MAGNTENYTSKFKVDISDLKKGIAEANKTIKTATAEFKNATAGMDSWSDSADGLTAKIKQQESVVEAEKKKLELLKEQLTRLNQNQEDGKKIISELTRKYEDAVQTYGKTSKEAKEYAKQLTDAESAQERNAKAAEELKLKIINQDTAIKNAEAQVSKYQSALEELRNHTETLTEKVQRQQKELTNLKKKYVDVTAEQGKESNEAKELARKISELSGELKENCNKLNDARLSANEFDNSVDKLDSSTETLTDKVKKQQSELNDLKEKYANVAAEQGKESEEVKELANRISELSGELKENRNKLNDARQSANELDNSVDQLDSSTETLTDKVKKQQSELNDLKEKYANVAAEQGKESEEAKELAGKISELSGELKENRNKLNDARLSANEFDNSVDQLESSTETLTDKVKTQQSELNDLKEKYANVAAEQGKESDEAKELANKISELSGELKENRTKLSDAEKAADEFDESLEDVGDSADKTTKGGLNAFSVALGNLASKVITAVIDKLKEMVFQTGQVGMSFDSAMSQVAGTFGYTTKQLSFDATNQAKAMQDLRDYSKEIAETTKFSATEAAEGMNYAAMAGWKSEEILEGYSGIVDLAAASNTELATTSDILTDALTAMKQPASEAGHFADVMAKTASNANTNVELMGETFKYVAPVAGSMGASIEDLAIATGLMANSGIKGSQAGNSLKNALTNLVKMSDPQKAAMQQLGLIATETKRVFDDDTIQKAQSKVADKTGDLEKKQIAYNTAVSKYGAESSQAQTKLIDLEKAERKLEEAQNDLTIAQQGTIETLAGQSMFQDEYGNMKSLGKIMDILRSNLGAIDVALTDSEGNVREYDDIISELEQSENGLTQAEQLKNAAIIFGKENLAGMLAIVNASEKDYNNLTDAVYNSKDAAKNMSETMIDNLGGDLTILKSKLQAIQIAIYEKFEPALRKIAEKVGEVMNTILEKIDVVSPVIENTINWVAEHGTEIIAVLSGIIAGIIAFKAVTVIQQAVASFKALASVIQLVGVKQAALNLIMSLNPVGLIVAAIAGLVTAFVVLWNKSDKFRNFWIGLWESIKSVFSGFIDSIIIGWETIASFFSDAGDSFKVGWNSIIDFFVNVWNNFQENFQIGMDSIANFFHSVCEKIKNFFEMLFTGIKNFALTAWDNVKTSWKIAGTWFNNSVVTPVKNFFVDMWNGVKNGAVQAWEGIKTTFAHIADWFEDKFSTAWQKVKNVFSAGGEVFANIKEGILSAFKNVVNGLIRGINTIIAIPFNAINDTLDRISTIDIGGFRPFEN